MINDTNIHKQVINSITFPIIIIDEHKLINMVNSAAEDFFKLSSKVLVEKSIESILPFSSPILSLIDNSLNTETTFKEYRVDLSTPISGSHKDVDVEVTPVIGSDNYYQIILIEGFNEKKLILQNENQKNKIAMSNMSQILAHEVKNPLAGIRGAAQILEKNIESNEIVMTDLIINEVDRIKRLVDNLQVFDASTPIDLKPINIHSILRHVRDVMINSSEKKIKITEVFDPSIPDIIGNEDQLIQVFINLIKNSIEAFSDESDSDNEIILSTNYEHGFIIKEKLSEERVKLPIKISVMDNGPGIPASISQEIFQPFVSTKKIGQGGLGLSIVSKIVSDHNGTIELDLTDQGTKFIIRLMAES
jgi:two-component system nitrogen regulation sensor histidine kinase GlnL